MKPRRAKSQHRSRPKPDHRSKNRRPGKPSGIKSDAEQMEERIREAADLICSGHRRTEIVEKMCKRHGVAWQTVQVYTRRARDLLAEESGRTIPEHRAEVFAKYQEILRAKKVDHSVLLHALKGKRELLGLDEPRRTEVSGPGGEALQINAQIDPNALELLSDDHINGILDRLLAARKESGPIIDLTGSRRGSEPGTA